MSEWYVDAHDPKMAHVASRPNSQAICDAKVTRSWPAVHKGEEPKDHERHIICDLHDRGEIRLVTRGRTGGVGESHGESD